MLTGYSFIFFAKMPIQIYRIFVFKSRYEVDTTSSCLLAPREKDSFQNESKSLRLVVGWGFQETSSCILSLKTLSLETPLVVQSLRLCIPIARDPGSIPAQRTRSLMLQLQVCMPQLKILYPTMKIKDPAFWN